MNASRSVLIRAATQQLERAGVPDAARDARLLARWAGGLDGVTLSVGLGETPDCVEAERFATAVARRADRVPLSHITGRRLFWGREFEVSSAVLDPRPETEVLIAEALHRGPFGRILDIGTGSGCILVTLLAEWAQATGDATDISEGALAVARSNARRLDVSARARFVHGSWQAGLTGPYDLIISNPPYIAQHEVATLAPEVRDHEPLLALSPGGDGLDAYRAILPAARYLLAPGGFILAEIGPTQPDLVSAICANAGLNLLMVIPDLDQRPRAILAQC